MGLANARVFPCRVVKMDAFVANTSKLLTLEREAERAESDDVAAVPLRVKELVSRGLCLTRLQVCGRRVGLYGREVVKLGARDGRKLDSHKLTSGNTCEVQWQSLPVLELQMD